MSLHRFCFLISLIAVLTASLGAVAQDTAAGYPGAVSRFDSGVDVLRLPDLNASLLPHPALPLMSPEVALRSFQEQGLRQTSVLPTYTDETLVIAELPETAQRGAFELQRSYVAPHSLSYKPVHFTGDSFVKSNVITRMLQSEVDFVAKGDPRQVALNDTNYKFSYKGLQDLNGHSVYLYTVKPRTKRVGLFKGRVYLDAHDGRVLRSEGSIEKSPSFFVRRLEFVQDYTTVDQFTLPTHLHSTAKARIIGRTVVDIYHRDYQVASAVQASNSLGQH